MGNIKNPYGDGNAAERITNILMRKIPSLQKKNSMIWIKNEINQ